MFRNHDDNERTRTFKDIFDDYLQDPSPLGITRIEPYSDILIKAGLEVIAKKIGEMCVQIYISKNPVSPSVKFTAFGSYWIRIFHELISEICTGDYALRLLFSENLLEILNGSDQDMCELAALILCNPLFLYYENIGENLLDTYNKATGHGKKLATAFALMKVTLTPEYFENEIFPRLPPEVSVEEIKKEYLLLSKVAPDLQIAKIPVLEQHLSSFLMQIIILDIGFHGMSWREVWPDWEREKEL